MDLKLEDVAELLNVSEKTVLRWISESKIPYYLLRQQYRFSRSEIENWVLSCKQSGVELSAFSEEESTDKEALGMHHYGLYRAIHKGGVYANIPGETKEEVIQNAMKLIAHDLRLDANVITELLLDRESLMPTSLSHGIGVPHTRDFLLEESFDVVAVVFPENPIEYGALDGEPVHTLFFLFACDDKRHLHLLAKLAHLSSKSDNRQFFRSHPTKAQLLDHIKHWESHLKMQSPKVPASV
ncbi:MAG TPA: PTS sugar transporter subunit IIA [Chlamydiales bacterium]|jgi:PTS system nitrogen regulatory IIA component